MKIRFQQVSLPVWILVFMIGGVTAGSLLAQSAGAFTTIADMNEARARHTATLLYNGKVLIAGGWDSTSPLASAELYDPATGTFIPTGNMTEAHMAHSATLLPDGRVLIAGGMTGNRDGSFPSYTAEIYDPSAGTFTATGKMAYSPSNTGTRATLFGSGKVLITGTEPAQLYDPVTGTFSMAGPYAVEAYIHPCSQTLTLLQDGRALFTGSDCVGDGTPTVELYDPDTNIFKPTGKVSGTMGWWGNFNTATLLPNGKVLIAGSDYLAFPADAELYELRTGLVAGIGKTLEPHGWGPTATLLSSGQVLLAGSELAGRGSSSAGAELYDPETGTFRSTGNMTTGRHLHTATLLRDGTVLLAGGISSGRSAEIYRVAAAPAAPKVRIVDNNTGSQTTLSSGDAFSFLVSGTAPRSEVKVSQAGWSASLGYTDADGSFTLNGIVAPTVVGTWNQTWSIGGVTAQPNPLTFTITAK